MNAQRVHYDLGGPKPPSQILAPHVDKSAQSELEALPESMQPKRRTLRQNAFNARSRERNRQETMGRARDKNLAFLLGKSA